MTHQIRCDPIQPRPHGTDWIEPAPVRVRRRERRGSEIFSATRAHTTSQVAAQRTELRRELAIQTTSSLAARFPLGPPWFHLIDPAPRQRHCRTPTPAGGQAASPTAARRRADSSPPAIPCCPQDLPPGIRRARSHSEQIEPTLIELGALNLPRPLRRWRYPSRTVSSWRGRGSSARRGGCLKNGRGLASGVMLGHRVSVGFG